MRMRMFVIVLFLVSMVGCRKPLHDLNTVIKKHPVPEVASD
jgi:hypothetical protein